MSAHWPTALLIAVTAVPLAAQPTAKPLDALKACRAIADGPARLACLDRESDALLAATARNDVVVMDKTEVKNTRRSLFGFALPRIALFGAGRDDGGNVDEIEVTIAGTRSLPGDHWGFTTDDGARWQTTEFTTTAPRNGGKATIKRAALGSYFVKFAGGRAVRAMRVQ